MKQRTNFFQVDGRYFPVWKLGRAKLLSLTMLFCPLLLMEAAAISKNEPMHFAEVFFIATAAQSHTNPVSIVEGPYRVATDATCFHVDPSVEGADVLTNALHAGRQAGYHLLSHGRPGELLLDGYWHDAEQLAVWLQRNAPDGQPVHIYGCEFGKGEQGRAAVLSLEAALGVCVAASDDVTGAEGDWELEVGNALCTIEIDAYPFNLQACPPSTTLLTPGSHVATCGVTNVNDPVLGIMYAENSAYSTTAIAPTTYYNPGWTAQNIGNIYFAEVAPNGAIYAPASLFTMSNWGAIFGAGNTIYQYGSLGGGANNLGAAGTIYRMDPITGNPIVWARLPQQAYSFPNLSDFDGSPARTTGPGLGGIVYDDANNRVYVVNMEDGRIYVFDALSTGPFPLTSANALYIYDPLSPDNGAAGMPPLGDRPFGLDIYNGRLYYTVHDNNPTNPTTGRLRVRSVQIGIGGPVAISDRLEVSLDVPALSFVSNYVVGDIDIHPDGRMAIGGFSSYGNYYYTQQVPTLYNHNAPVYVFDANSTPGSLTRLKFSSVGQFTWRPGDLSTEGTNNYTSSGGVSWNPCQTNNILWMAGGDLPSNNSNFGVIGYNYATLQNTANIMETSNQYIMYILANDSPTADQKGLGGDIDVFGYGCTCNICSVSTTTTCTGSNFTLSGEIHFQNQPTTGTMTVTVGGVTQTFNAPFTSPTSYSLTGLSGTGSQTVTVSFSATSCTLNTPFTAPTCNVCTTPTATLTPTPATCTGITANNDGTVTLAATTNATHYGVSLGATYTGPTTIAGATAFDAGTDLPLDIITNAPNAGATYSVRIFNGADDCFVAEMVVVAANVCPLPVCDLDITTSAVCQVGETGKYDLTVTLNYTNSPGGAITVTLATGETASSGATIAASSGSETVTFTNLFNTGTTGISVTAAFLDDAACTVADTYDSPADCCPAPFPLCPGESYTLTAETGWQNYQWYFDDGLGGGPVIIPGANSQIYATANQVGTYTWTAEDAMGCPVQVCCPIVLEAGTSCCTLAATALATCQDPLNGTYDLVVTLDYTGSPGGDLTVTLGTGQMQSAPTAVGDGQVMVSFTGLTNTAATNVTISTVFAADPTCNDAITYNAPVSCCPVVEAGQPQALCSTQSLEIGTLGASITPTGGGTWSSSGDGTFVGGMALDAATAYQPGPNDVAAGTVTLTLTSTACGGSDSVTLSILKVNCGAFPWNGN